ncbi:MAG TPA: AI-2E family transporter [Patescibacteria group bacterium]
MEYFWKKYILENKIVMALAVVVLAWVLYDLRRVVILVFSAFIISAAFLPFVNFLTRKKVPRLAASLIPILGFVAAIILLIVPMSTLVTGQFQSFINSLPGLIKEANQVLPVKVVPEQVLNNSLNNIGNFGVNLFTITGTVLDKLVYLFLMLFVSFYFLYDNDNIRGISYSFLPKIEKQKWIDTEKGVEAKLGDWVRGQVIISVSLGVLYWIIYTVIGLPFGLVLAILGAFLEIIPNLGPLLSIVPALIIGLTVSPVTAVYVIAGFVLIHITESYILVPKIMERSVGLHPVVIALGIFSGSILYGFWGALLAIPIMSVASILLKKI